MSRIEAKKIAKKYSDLLKKRNFPFEEVVLFGSAAKGTAGVWSDIDIAIVSKYLETDFIKKEMELARISVEIDSRIEPHGVTTADFKKNSTPFILEIKKTGVLIKS